MRAVFIEALVELAEDDPRIVFLTGDLGYTAVEPFAERFPSRFFNVGVAEQNMLGLATGLAEGGFTPFVYSIAPFAVLRPYEFLRNGPIQHRLPVRIVGVGGGFEYGSNGFSHYALEDIAVLRAQRAIRIIAPGDFQQVRTALPAAHKLPEPVYFRLSKDNKSTVAGLEGRFALDQAQLLRDGRDLLLVALGTAAVNAVEAAKQLGSEGIDAAVALVDNLGPRPPANLVPLLTRFRDVVTVEAHSIDGGLGSLVCEIVAEEGLDCRVMRRAVAALEPGLSGSQAYLEDRYGLSAEKLAAAAAEVFQKA